MPTPCKIAFIGAGSTVFVKDIIGDIFLSSSLQRAHIALMDIDRTRLDQSEMVVRKLASTHAPDAVITVHHEQQEALADADFVVVCFQIGGYEPCTVIDFEIPKRYGLQQTIGDTLGIGGIMRGLRTIPHLWAVAQDMRNVCPQALMLQYANPMAMNMWALASKYPDVRSVGLCHSVQHTLAELAADLEIDKNEISFKVAGINHLAFFLELEHKQADGSVHDLYPQLREGYAKARLPKPNQMYPRCPNNVRYEMMMRLGYFVTESSEHFAEYVPWFIKSSRPELIERFGIPLDEYPKRCEEQIQAWSKQVSELEKATTLTAEPSVEFAAQIIEATVANRDTAFHGNVANKDSLIANLPADCCVEVPCIANADGIAPQPVGQIPAQLAALMRSNIAVQELVVKALCEQKREHIYHASMMDPHTAAELDLDSIWSMVDDLLAAHRTWLPGWIYA